jgi:hypothetical protein
MPMKALFVASAIVMAAIPARAADVLVPGIWDITVTIESIDGSAVTPEMKRNLTNQVPQNMKQCLSAEQLKPAAEKIAADSKGKCKSTAFSMVGGKLATAAECTGPDSKMTSKTAGTYTPKSYSIRSTNIITNPQGTVMTKSMMVGKWIAACKK